MPPTSSPFAPSPRFPLPRDALPRITIPPDESATCRLELEGHLHHALEAFDAHLQQRRVVDRRTWKKVLTRKGLTLHKSRFGHRTGAKAMLLVGEVRGTVAEAMHALVTTSDHDLALVNVFLHRHVADAALLQIVDAPGDGDPWRFFGYKWFVKRSRTSSHVVSHRDALYAELTGRTPEGMGFHVIESVSLPGFPSFKSRNCIRFKQSIQTLYRQRGDGIVEIFMLGRMEFPRTAAITRSLASLLVARTLFSMTKTAACGRVKQMTSRVYGNIARMLTTPAADRRRSGTCQRCSEAPRRRAFCPRPTLRECDVCLAWVCAECRGTRAVFVSEGQSTGRFVSIVCCLQCEANDDDVDLYAIDKDEPMGIRPLDLTRSRGSALTIVSTVSDSGQFASISSWDAKAETTGSGSVVDLTENILDWVRSRSTRASVEDDVESVSDLGEGFDSASESASVIVGPESEVDGETVHEDEEKHDDAHKTPTPSDNGRTPLAPVAPSDNSQAPTGEPLAKGQAAKPSESDAQALYDQILALQAAADRAMLQTRENSLLLTKLQQQDRADDELIG